MTMSATDRALSYWPTPAELADDLVYWVMAPWHATGAGVRVLEPSAGDGALVAAIRRRLPDAHITAVEPAADRAALLRADGRADVVIEGTIENFLADQRADDEPYHLVIMNPPFTLPGQPEAWADHILGIWRNRCLAPGGVVSAIVPRIALTGRSRRVREVRALFGDVGGVKPGPAKGFGAAVATALIWAEKPYSDGPEPGSTW